MSVYFLINILIIIFPFLFSFEKRIQFYKNWPALLGSILTVGVSFILWDMYATKSGHWNFNPKYVGHFKIGVLPFEEILFFITAPYSCIFIYEAICYARQKKVNDTITCPKFLILLVIFSALILSWMYRSSQYTMICFIVFAGFCANGFRRGKENLFQDKRFWMFMLFSFIGFHLVHEPLTALPVVSYSPQAIIGYRIGTIPIEDYFYNFAYLGFSLWAYQIFRRRKGM